MRQLSNTLLQVVFVFNRGLLAELTIDSLAVLWNHRKIVFGGSVSARFLMLVACRAKVSLGGNLPRQGIMGLDQNTPAVDEARTPAPLLSRSLRNRMPERRFGFAFRAGKPNLSPLLSKDFVLDFTERVIVLLLFLYFSNKMLPRFTELITLEIAHPELLWLAASTNLDAALLVISESLGVFLILTRRFATTVSARPLDWAFI